MALVSTAATAGFVAFSRRTAEVNPAFEPLQYRSVIPATILSGYAAYLVFQALKKYINRPYESFMYLSGFIFLISYMPVGHVAVGMQTAGKPEINVLSTIHAIAAVFIIGGIAKLEMMERKEAEE